MVYVLPLLCFVIPLILGVLAVRHGYGWTVPTLAGLAALVIVWAIWRGQQEQGWDGIGYAIVAFFMAAPVMFGILAGGIIGWLQRRRRARR
ncbi:hypothetical protein [uncultured Roseovarius sp.]|uniref:hypothetical protein n=1 Tax=uncultured Roseovarius sp. TaxID=293344 RepID=UPI00260192BB|nr:hypothetical protein [uncultured Roseovarius sp.]